MEMKDLDVERVTIRLGGFTKPVTKVGETMETFDAAAKHAVAHNTAVLVKPVRGGWQGWEKRANARGAAHPGDYEFLPTGRRARKRKITVPGGVVYQIVGTDDGSGNYEASAIRLRGAP